MISNNKILNESFPLDSELTALIYELALKRTISGEMKWRRVYSSNITICLSSHVSEPEEAFRCVYNENTVSMYYNKPTGEWIMYIDGYRVGLVSITLINTITEQLHETDISTRSQKLNNFLSDIKF